MLLMGKGPRVKGNWPLVVLQRADLYRLFDEEVMELRARVSREATGEEAWISWAEGLPVGEGEEIPLHRRFVDYGPNSRRFVYQGPDWGRMRFGVTLNLSGWSSFPPHGFERVAKRIPEGFTEKFFFFAICRQPGFWPRQMRGLLAQGNGFTEIYDEICYTITPGIHAVVAAPGCELGYVWAYSSDRPIVKEIRDGKYLEDLLDEETTSET